MHPKQQTIAERFRTSFVGTMFICTGSVERSSLAAEEVMEGICVLERKFVFLRVV
jgi:hypothetical protein